MTRQSRRLVGVYLVFLLFLAAMGSGEPGVLIQAAGGGLSASATDAPASRPHPPILVPVSAALAELGFTPTPSGRFGSLRVDGRNNAPQRWLYAGNGPARKALAAAESRLAEIAAEHGGYVNGQNWSTWAGMIRLELTIAAAPADSAGLRVELSAPADSLVTLERRPDSGNIIRMPSKDHPTDGLKPVPKPPLPPKPPPTPPPPPPLPPRRPRVAIVLDDVGEIEGTEAFIALPAQITFAILPLRPYSETYARQAKAAGRTVILHQPLEAVSGLDPGEGVIRIGWSPEEIRAQLEANLASVPGAIGANNHMGSLGTAEAPLMREILGLLHERGMFFLDSRTPDPRTGRPSIVPTVARSLGMRFDERDVFLDDPVNASVAQIKANLRKLISIAKSRGTAVGICHCNRPNTLAALREMIGEFEKAGVEIVPLNEIMG